ncbi:sigma factor G inhibitor Gin [Bacillus manliponensis]|uniref:sigma factor G inhibitor Gin n=1 Tax=Bacillus manliponensis TaxID=574376 RepID=UPI003519671D
MFIMVYLYLYNNGQIDYNKQTHMSGYTKVQEEICIICECEQKNGIYLYRSFICEECERDMVKTDTEDPKYTFYLQQLRKIKQHLLQ